jgi:hypothetical protein
MKILQYELSMVLEDRIYTEVIFIHRNLVRNYRTDKQNGGSIYYAEILFFLNEVPISDSS